MCTVVYFFYLINSVEVQFTAHGESVLVLPFGDVELVRLADVEDVRLLIEHSLRANSRNKHMHKFNWCRTRLLSDQMMCRIALITSDVPLNTQPE